MVDLHDDEDEEDEDEDDLQKDDNTFDLSHEELKSQDYGNKKRYEED